MTVYRWVLRFTLLLADAGRPCCHAVGIRWCVDETYVKVAGRWRYVYRAIDQTGQVIDVLVSARRDARTARGFFEPALETTKVTPSEVTIRYRDAAAATYSFFEVGALVRSLRGLVLRSRPLTWPMPR